MVELTSKKVILEFGGMETIAGWLDPTYKKEPPQGLLTFKRTYFVCTPFPSSSGRWLGETMTIGRREKHWVWDVVISSKGAFFKILNVYITKFKLQTYSQNIFILVQKQYGRKYYISSIKHTLLVYTSSTTFTCKESWSMSMIMKCITMK